MCSEAFFLEEKCLPSESCHVVVPLGFMVTIKLYLNAKVSPLGRDWSMTEVTVAGFL